MNVLKTNDLSVLKPVGTGQAMTSSDTPQSFTAFAAAAKCVLVTVRTQAVSVTMDGVTAADSAVGLNLPIGYVGLFSVEAATAMSIHQSAGGAATVYAQAMG